MITHNNRTYLTIEELSEYLPEQPPETTIYQWTWKRKIPYKKFGRRVYFDREIIDLWNDKGRPFASEMLND